MKLSRLGWSEPPEALLEGYDGSLHDLCFDYWRYKLELDEIEAVVEWEVCRRYVLPLIGSIRAGRLSPELLAAWSLILGERIDERTALLARRVLADVVQSAGADRRRVMDALSLTES